MTQSVTAFASGGRGIDAIRFETVKLSTPGPDEILVALRAASLNYRDLIGVYGKLPDLTRDPEYIPLSCGVGTVTAIGGNVTRVKLGDRVMPQFAQGWLSGGMENIGTRHLGGQADGVARTHGIFNAESVSIVPDELGDLEAATLPCAGITAWSALTGPRPVKQGDWVLVQGTGGVSMAALLWAKAMGGRVIVTSSSDAKLARAKSLGADAGINYRNQKEWAQVARKISNGHGMDIIVDVAGTGALDEAAQALAPDGVIAAIGMLDGAFSWGADAGGANIVPVTVGNRASQDEMLVFAAKHGIRPVVDAVYPLSRLADAMRHLESGAFFGKIGISLL